MVPPRGGVYRAEARRVEENPAAAATNRKNEPPRTGGHRRCADTSFQTSNSAIRVWYRSGKGGSGRGVRCRMSGRTILCRSQQGRGERTHWDYHLHQCLINPVGRSLTTAIVQPPTAVCRPPFADRLLLFAEVNSRAASGSKRGRDPQPGGLRRDCGGGVDGWGPVGG